MQPDECACLMLINKPEEDDGITGQFNHLCRTHPAAATSSNASPRAPRQIFEAWHFTPAGTRYRLSTRSLYTLSTLSLDSRQPLSTRPPAPSTSQRAPTHAAQGPATPRPSTGSCCRPPTGSRRQGQGRAPTGRPGGVVGGHPSVEGRTRAAREVLSVDPPGGRLPGGGVALRLALSTGPRRPSLAHPSPAESEGGALLGQWQRVAA